VVYFFWEGSFFFLFFFFFFFCFFLAFFFCFFFWVGGWGRTAVTAGGAAGTAPEQERDP